MEEGREAAGVLVQVSPLGSPFSGGGRVLVRVSPESQCNTTFKKRGKVLVRFSPRFWTGTIFWLRRCRC